MSTIKEIDALLELESRITDIRRDAHVYIDDYRREMLIVEIFSVIDRCNSEEVSVSIDEISRIETGLRNVLLGSG